MKIKHYCPSCKQEKETPDTPCPYCGGGRFQNVWDYEPPEHLPPVYRDYAGNYNIGFCPRCLMEEKEASEKDCFYPKWATIDKENIIKEIAKELFLELQQRKNTMFVEPHSLPLNAGKIAMNQPIGSTINFEIKNLDELAFLASRLDYNNKQ